MAATELRAELRLRDGQKRSLSVPVENSLKSIRDGVNDLNKKASQLLSDLVAREAARGGCAADELDEDSDEDSDEEDGTLNSEVQPPPKRSKT